MTPIDETSRSGRTLAHWWITRSIASGTALPDVGDARRGRSRRYDVPGTDRNLPWPANGSVVRAWRSTITAAKPVAVDTNRDPDQLGSPSSPALTDVRGTVASKRKQPRIRGGQAKGQTVPDKGSRASPGSPDTRATTKAGLKLPVRAAPRLWPLVGPATPQERVPCNRGDRLLSPLPSFAGNPEFGTCTPPPPPGGSGKLGTPFARVQSAYLIPATRPGLLWLGLLA